MKRAAHVVIGALLIASAVFLSRDLIEKRDLLILAALAPVIVAATAFGALLLVRAVRG